MAVFPTRQFDRQFVKVRFLSVNGSRSINQRWMGMPRGVYLGFIPSVVSGSDLLTLNVDPRHNFSLLKVGCQSSRVQVDLFTADPVVLNFAGHTEFPVYVIGRADFQISDTTQASILTRTTTASGPHEVLICKVDKVGSNLTIDYGFPASRQPPIAFEGQAVGFMYEGAIDDIVIGNSATSEVTAARESAHTSPPTHPDLATRINADLIGPSMADRLGLRQSLIVGNAVLGVSSDVVNVSGSFTETGREFEPSLNIAGDGSETVEGAITDPSDATRNLCFIINDDNGQRVVDQTDGEPVYGRLQFDDTIALASGKQIRFYNASTFIDGGDPGTNPFQAPLEEGDIVEAPDGRFYEIVEFTDTNTARLGAAYQGTGAPDVAIWTGSSDPEIRRFEVEFHTVASDPGTVTLSGENIRFLFPAFFRVDRTIYDGYLLLKKDGELPPVPTATASVLGKGLLAVADGKAGSLRTIEQGGVPQVNDAHTINFVYGNQYDSIVQDAGGGVCEVTIRGARGPTGPDSNVGDTGPQGPLGYGFGPCVPFVAQSTWSPSAQVIGQYTNTWTHNFAGDTPSISTIRHLWGGYAGFRPSGGWQQREVVDLWWSGSTGNITYRITSEGGGNTWGDVKMFMGAAGE